MKIKRILFLLVLSIVFKAIAQQDRESQFYKKSTYKKIKLVDLVDDYKVDPNDPKDDSDILQKAIDELAELKYGGTIIIPKGNYQFAGVVLKSNVHIKIDSKAVITIKPRKKRTHVFALGTKNNPAVENVSVSCLKEGKKYTVDFSNIVGEASLFNLGNVRNFMLADFKVYDNFTKFSAVRMGIVPFKGSYYMPVYGVIKNAVTINSHYGYGLIQAQAARNVLFKDLKGVGGATLRMETGAKISNDTQKGGVDGIFARNISCKDGNSAVMISPHALKNGTVDIDGVYAENTGFGVRVEDGFIAKKYDKSKVSKKGTFKNVKVNNVRAVYGSTSQLKSKHFKFLPCTLINTIVEAPKETYTIGGTNLRAIYHGSSIVPVLATHDFPVQVSNVDAVGFSTKPVIYDEDTYDCEALKKKKKGKKKKKKQH